MQIKELVKISKEIEILKTVMGRQGDIEKKLSIMYVKDILIILGLSFGLLYIIEKIINMLLGYGLITYIYIIYIITGVVLPIILMSIFIKLLTNTVNVGLRLYKSKFKC